MERPFGGRVLRESCGKTPAVRLAPPPVPREGQGRRKLHQRGNRIVAREDRELDRPAQRPKVIPRCETTGAKLSEAYRHVGEGADPPDPDARAHLGDGPAMRLVPEEIRKVEARAPAEAMPAPHARVHIEQLQATVARITLELDLDDPVEAKRIADPAGGMLDLGRVHGLDVGARAAEVHRPLAEPPYRHR